MITTSTHIRVVDLTRPVLKLGCVIFFHTTTIQHYRSIIICDGDHTVISVQYLILFLNFFLPRRYTNLTAADVKFSPTLFFILVDRRQRN